MNPTYDWLRRASGDDRRQPWRLTPERLDRYLAGVRGMAQGGPAVQMADSGAVLDADRQPALRPWELDDAVPSAGVPDPAQLVADGVASRPALAAAIEAHVPVTEFAAAHVALMVCVRALLLLAGQDADRVTVARVKQWVATQPLATGADADFVATLVTFVAGRAQIEATYAGR